MSLMKSGGISARTKSLRDKFKQKRSFSELSFQAPSTSTSSLATSDVSSRPGSLRRPRSHAPNLCDQVSLLDRYKRIKISSPLTRTDMEAQNQSVVISVGFPAETLIQLIIPKMHIAQLLISIAKVMSLVFLGKGMLQRSVILVVIFLRLVLPVQSQLILQQPIYYLQGSKHRKNFHLLSTSDFGKVLHR